jgi:hypothetical protein
LTVEISSDGATIWKNFRMNNSIDTPPNAQHQLLGVWINFRCCYACLTSAESLTPVRVVNVQHPLLIASDKIAEPLVVAMRCHSIHTSINPVLKLMW